MTRAVTTVPKRHDCRGSLWIIAGGGIIWCYQCGSWRLNIPSKSPWHRPSGIGGKNPALSE